ncbi:hypothetical protein GTC6_05682 [Gordonia terrae C-6]|uniref:Uncharacterized protein n=1 Tax=Gordonia terrae C-6 TaxID=1316928 RepID=R7YCV9_9ACTN|nr:YaaC family protein [Gordonia terrae]EON33833.1 hypothetical protein GTC6_05682 [Gordonia terrae C-6]
MKLAAALPGTPLKLKGRELDFSLYPMVRTNRRWGIHSTLYATDPWAVIAGSVTEALVAPAERAAAASFINQAREYFTAAERASSIETRPLLYYYSFLNLAKAIAMGRGRPGLVGKVRHGVAHEGTSGHGVGTAKLQIGSSSATAKSAIDELHWALEGSAVSVGHYQVSEIISQSVIAHRMWREAFAQPRVERFIPIDRVQFMHDEPAKLIWLRVFVSRAVLKSRNRGLTETLRESGLDSTFRGVTHPDADVDAEFRILEQRVAIGYTGRAADVVVNAVDGIRPYLWQTITASAPFRRFYLYLSPSGERRVPQWLSTYTTLFWLGSLTRYQPVELFEALDGKFGPFFREFLETQPRQLLYILASDAKRQNVTRGVIV